MADSVYQVIFVCLAALGALLAGLFHRPLWAFFHRPSVQEVLVNIDWLKLIEQIAPLAVSAIPGGAVIAPFIVSGIQVAQAAHQQSVAAGGPGLTGQDKLNLAVAEVINGVNAVAQVAPTKVDPVQVAAAISSTVDVSKRIAAIIATAKTSSGPNPPAVATPPVV